MQGKQNVESRQPLQRKLQIHTMQLNIVKRDYFQWVVLVLCRSALCVLLAYWFASRRLLSARTSRWDKTMYSDYKDYWCRDYSL